MADPKYDKLYGIARDQPDVYETSDLPEADQPGEIYEEISEAVERLHINASDAFNKFQDKEVDLNGVDFSDRIGRKNRGYNVRHTHLELAAFGEKETPLQKYNRLKLEIGNLVDEVSNYSSKKNEDLAAVPNELSVSVESSKQLFSQLAELKLEDKIGLDLGKNVEQQIGQQFTEILHHIDKLCKVSENAPGTGEPRKIEIIDKNSVQFNLSLSPSQRIQLTSRITELEQKLGKLETLIGSSSNQAIRFCNVNLEDGLVNCCQWMIAKLSLLDISQLDAIENKLSNVNSRLEQCLNAQNSLSQDPEKEKKINELYELAEKSRARSELIPDLIDRMVAIDSMHKQGKQSVQMISHLEAVQNELSASLAQNNAMMKSVKEVLESNVTLIKSNIESLQGRVDALMKSKK